LVLQTTFDYILNQAESFKRVYIDLLHMEDWLQSLKQNGNFKNWGSGIHINSQWAKDLNEEAEIVKVLEENKRNLPINSLHNDFLDVTSKHR
jgi:hypothetical protein